MAASSIFFLLTNISAFSEKCSIYDSPCLSSWTQSYADVFVPGGTGFGFEPLDPMSIEDFSGNQEGYVYSLSDIEIVGLKNLVVEKVQFNKKEKRYHIKIRVPLLAILANYKTDGLIQGKIPFKGEGQMYFKLYDFVNELTINYEMTKGENGMHYIKCNEFFYWFDFDYFEPYVQNRNMDAPVKVDELQHFFKTEGKKLWQQYGRDLLDRVNDKIFKMVQKVYLLQPTENILSDY